MYQIKEDENNTPGLFYKLDSIWGVTTDLNYVVTSFLILAIFTNLAQIQKAKVKLI